MIANIRNFGNMDMNDANRELKENLKAVKSQAEALEHGMDLMIRRIDFEPEEIGKWEALRKALVDFRTIEVNPNIAQNVMISVENMDKLTKFGTIQITMIKLVLIVEPAFLTDN